MTQPIGYHVVFRLRDGRVIAPTPGQRRTAARIILEQFRGARLLCFNVSDTHGHVEHAESEAVGAELIRQSKISISGQLKLPVRFARDDSTTTIASQSHLLRAFDYILRQQPRHKLAWDPYHEASNLSDLLGLRTIGVQTASTVRQLLPRVDRRWLLAVLGVPELVEFDGPPHQLLEAARAASGVTDLRRRSPQVRSVWRALLAVTEGQLPIARVASLLEIARETLFRARSSDVPDLQLVRAIRLQLGLRQAIRPSPLAAFTDESPGGRVDARHHA